MISPVIFENALSVMNTAILLSKDRKLSKLLDFRSFSLAVWKVILSLKLLRRLICERIRQLRASHFPCFFEFFLSLRHCLFHPTSTPPHPRRHQLPPRPDQWHSSGTLPPLLRSRVIKSAGAPGRATTRTLAMSGKS